MGGFRLRIPVFGRVYGIEWDRNYGMDRRRGWSVTYDGSYLVELEPWLIVALFRAFRTWRLCE